MSNLSDIKRRQFLKSTAAMASLASFAPMLSSGTGFGAERVEKAGAKNKEALEELMAELDAKGRQFLSVPKKDGQFLNLLVKATRSKSVLEIGTSHGYSAIWISLALEETGGKMATVEILPERVQLAKQHVEQAGLTHRVTFHQGDAHKVVTTLAGPFDFVFLDADKDGQMDYFHKLYPDKLLPGGIIAVHNAIRSRGPMKEYLDAIGQHPDFDSVILSLTMEDGFSVSYRKRT